MTFLIVLLLSLPNLYFYYVVSVYQVYNYDFLRYGVVRGHIEPAVSLNQMNQRHVPILLRTSRTIPSKPLIVDRCGASRIPATTVSFASAIRLAVAKPMPLPAPVARAILP